jgi:hypothetical protein
MSLGKRHPPPVRGLLHKFYLRRTSNLAGGARVSNNRRCCASGGHKLSGLLQFNGLDVCGHHYAVLAGLLIQPVMAPGTTILQPRVGPT